MDPYLVLLQSGVYIAKIVTNLAVGSYSTVSPLPARTQAVFSLWRFPSGYPGRALPAAVVLWSPDFPHTRRHAAAQPSALIIQ